MEFTHKIGEHTFKVLCNDEQIFKTLDDELNEFEENTFVRTCNDNNTEFLSKEEYVANVEEITQEIHELLKEPSLIRLIEYSSKKQDGSFIKSRVVREIYSDNSKSKLFIPSKDAFAYRQPNHYSQYKKNKDGAYINRKIWTFNRLKVKAIDNNTLRISYNQTIYSPIWYNKGGDKSENDTKILRKSKDIDVKIDEKTDLNCVDLEDIKSVLYDHYLLNFDYESDDSPTSYDEFKKNILTNSHYIQSIENVEI